MDMDYRRTIYEFLPQAGAKSDSNQGTRMPHATIDDRVLVNEGASEAVDGPN